MFQPHLVGLETPGVHQNVVSSIMKCDAELRQQMFGNIVLSGGSTLFPGFAERLQKEVEALAHGLCSGRLVSGYFRRELERYEATLEDLVMRYAQFGVELVPPL